MLETQNGLPLELKLTFLAALMVVMLFVFFIVIAVVIYSKKQKALLTEKRLKQIEFDNELLQSELNKINALQTERNRISMDMHDDLGSGLSSIKIISHYLQKQTSDDAVLKELHDINAISDGLTTSMRELVWSLNSKHDTVDAFLSYVADFLNHLFQHSTIKLKLNLPAQQSNAPINGFVRRNLFLTLKEIANNIIKHSQASQANFSFNLVDHSKLEIVIQDNGIGIPHNVNKKGNGLFNIQKRLKDIEAIYTAVNNNGLEHNIQITL